MRNTVSSPSQQHAGQGDPRHAYLLPAIVLAGFLARSLLVAEFPRVQADEGLWTTSTKNFLLFGDWFMDERAHLFLSPVFHLLSLPFFALMDPSIEAARWLSVLAGTACIPLVYLLAFRLFSRRDVALAAAAILALDPWSIIHSRQAMTEAVLLFFVLAAAVLLLGSRRAVVGAGVAMALAILTKLNAAAMGLPLGGYLLLRRNPDGSPRGLGQRVGEAAIFGSVALGLAAIGYWAISMIDPERFVAVFARELGGEHVRGEPGGGGRIGLNPVLAGTTLLELLRLNPFLFVFAGLGGVLLALARPPGWTLLGAWLAVGLGFPVLQVYQPIRYFFPVVPALVLLASYFAASLATIEPHRSLGRGSRLVVGAIVLITGFGGAYTVMNFAANRGSDARVVEAWVRANTDAREPILAAAYLATNPPNPVYAHDIVRLYPGGLGEAVVDLGVRFIVWDAAEWSPDLTREVESSYEELERWHFGAVFRVQR